MSTICDKYYEFVKDDNTNLKEELSPLKEAFEREALIYGKDEVRFLNVPYIVTKDKYKNFEYIVDTTYRILDKITKKFISDRSFRKLFGFSNTLNKLIISHSHYPDTIPIMRMDIFYDEESGKAKFCEINTDGTGAMRECMEIQKAFAQTNVFNEISKKYSLKFDDLYEKLVDSILSSYFKSDYKTENPVIAIVDYAENSYMIEYLTIKHAFEKRGYECIMANLPDLDFKHKYLYYGDKKIDLVYRRAQTCELMNKIGESKAFIKNALEGRTAVMGHFKTQVAHNKMLFALLDKPQIQKILTDEENAFIKEYFPFTTQMKNGNYNFNEIKYSKNNWVVKPKDMYGASNVYVGCDLTQQEWEDALEKAISEDFILQEYCPAYKIKNSYFDKEGNLIEDRFGTMIGLYVFGGKLVGFLPRASNKGIIAGYNGGFSMGTFTEE